MANLVFPRGHCEVERRAFIDFRFGPNPAAMLVNDTLHRSQANARAFEVLPAVKALENSEEFPGILHVETDPVVADENGRTAIQHQLAELDDRRFAGPRVFHGIR